jgi:hypothetical protein
VLKAARVKPARRSALFEAAVFGETIEAARCLLRQGKNAAHIITGLGGVLARIANLEDELQMGFGKAWNLAASAASESEHGNYEKAIDLLNQTFSAVFKELEPLSQSLILPVLPGESEHSSSTPKYRRP